VHNVIFVEYLKGIDELFEDEQGLFFGYNSIFPEHAFECASVAVFIDEVEVIGSLEHVYVLDNVLIFFDIGENIDFVDCAFL